jgi:hypothetical protein
VSGAVLGDCGSRLRSSQDDDRDEASDEDRKDLFSLSTNREWNLLSELCDPIDLGGDDDVDAVDDDTLLGDCRLARDDVRMFTGPEERCAGLKKSAAELGDVDRLGHSLRLLSDALRLLSDVRLLDVCRCDL